MKSSTDFIDISHGEEEKNGLKKSRLRFYKMDMIGNRETDARYACVISTV